MENKLKLTKNDCEDIGFVKSSVISGAINRDELKKWAALVIQNSNVDEVPLYIFDLIDFDGYLYDLSKVIGFTPYSGLNNNEDDALYGIAIKRFGLSFDVPVSQTKALKALNDNPNVLNKFKKIFPFIDLNF